MSLTDIDLIRASRYFDAKWYSTEYPDAKGVDPCWHYLQCGWREGRSPSKFFIGSKYLEAYPDVAAAAISPLVHFLRHGLFEKRWAGIEHELPILEPLREDTSPTLKDDADLLRRSFLFDAAWYRLNYGYFSELDPVIHYLTVGAFKGFAPSPRFDGKAYSQRYPDIGKTNPLVHYLRRGRAEGRPLSLSFEQQGVLDSTISSLAHLEPDLSTENRFHSQSHDLVVNQSLLQNTMASSWRRIYAQLDARVKYMVMVPWLVRGGADLAAVNVLRALQEQYGKDCVVLVITDHNRVDAIDWIPSGTRAMRFTEDGEVLGIDERKKLVETLIWTFRPNSVFNVNSRACWDAYAQTGRALSKMSSLRALLFCRDYSSDGRAVGYSDTHFRPSISYLDRIYFDTFFFQRDIADQYGLPEHYLEKLGFLPQPFDERLAAVNPFTRNDRPRILWAGRLSAQKNLQLLREIIRRAPHMEFDIYGSGASGDETELSEFCKHVGNAQFLGSFSSLEQLPLRTYTAFLFTSRYEGMPTILLNVAAIGLPIVATSIGGVSELIDPATGWAIPELDDPEPYICALNEICQKPEAVAHKLERMSQKLSQERTWNIFKHALFT